MANWEQQYEEALETLTGVMEERDEALDKCAALEAGAAAAAATVVSSSDSPAAEEALETITALAEERDNALAEVDTLRAAAVAAATPTIPPAFEQKLKKALAEALEAKEAGEDVKEDLEDCTHELQKERALRIAAEGELTLLQRKLDAAHQTTAKAATASRASSSLADELVVAKMDLKGCTQELVHERGVRVAAEAEIVVLQAAAAAANSSSGVSPPPPPLLCLEGMLAVCARCTAARKAVGGGREGGGHCCALCKK
jgi:hypothetical protein